MVVEFASNCGWLTKFIGTNGGVRAVLSGLAGFSLCFPSLHSLFTEPLLDTEREGYTLGSSESLRSPGWTQREPILIHGSYLFTERWSRRTMGILSAKGENALLIVFQRFCYWSEDSLHKFHFHGGSIKEVFLGIRRPEPKSQADFW